MDSSSAYSVDDEKTPDLRRNSMRNTDVNKDFLDEEEEFDNIVEYWTNNVLDAESILQIVDECGDTLWDADLKKRQKEWVDLLLLANDIGLPTDPKTVNLHKNACLHLPPSEKDILAASWIDDSIHARQIYFPENKIQNWCYTTFRGRELRFLFNLAFFCQIVGPIFEVPYYSSYSSWSVTSWDAPNGYLSRNTLCVFDIIFVSVFLFDCVCIFVANPPGLSSVLHEEWKWSVKTFFKVPSGLFRFVASIFIIVDCIQTISGVDTKRWTRALVPLIFITRRGNYRSIAKGVTRAINKTGSILKFIFFIILIFGYIGNCLFSNFSSTLGGREEIEQNEDTEFTLSRFNTFGGALETCLLCFTSRVSSLFIMQDFYKINQFSALYFVCLSLIADMILMSLMTAIGSSEMGQYSVQLLMSRMRRRYEAALAAFVIMQQPDERTGEGSYLPIDTWQGVVKCIPGKYRISANTAKCLFLLENALEGSPPGLVSFTGFLRLCAALSSKVRMSNDLKNRILARPARKGVAAIVEAISEKEHTPREHTMVSRINSKTQSVISPMQAAEVGRLSEGVNFDRTLSTASASTIEAELANEDVSTAHGTKKQWLLLRKFARYLFSLRIKFCGIFETGVMDVISLSLLMLNVIYLSMVSTGRASANILAFGFLLEMGYSFESLMQKLATGSHYLKKSGRKYQLATNVVCFCFMFDLLINGIDHKNNTVPLGPPLTLNIVGNGARLLRLFAMVRASSILESIEEAVRRVLFIIFCAIYFFSVLAYINYHDSLSPASADNADDDARRWSNLHNLLNFRTFPQSLHTCYQLTIIGNWSTVMSAAAATKHTSALFFFYFYRISVSMIMMPIVLSFVIQTFVSQRKKMAGIIQHRENPFKNGLPKHFIEVFEVDYNDYSDDSFEDYQIRAYPGTANISLWAITGSDTYSKNDANIVRTQTVKAKRRQTVLDLTQQRFSLSARDKRKALFTQSGPSRMLNHPDFHQEREAMSRKEISSMSRHELETIYMQTLADLEQERNGRN